MLESFKRLFARALPESDLGPIEDWARRRGHGFKRARSQDGFVIDGLLEGKPWRMEWGPSQRDYIDGQELRLRMELDLPSDAQMLVLSRSLMDSLERKTFEEFTDAVQTQIGTNTPEEMRWLVMFPKVDLANLRSLRTRFGAVASAPATGLAWLEGPLANLLEQAALDWLAAEAPLMLMTLRGRAYLRLHLAAPDTRIVAAALALFETAVTQAIRAAGAPAGTLTDPTTGHPPSAWQSFPPEAGIQPPKRR